MQSSTSLIKVLAWWLLGLMVVIVGFAITVVMVNSSVFAPENQVKQYFSVLKAGDGPKALGLLNASAPDANAALLNGAGLKKAMEGVTDLDVHQANSSSEGDGRATVEASYKVNGKPGSMQFSLEPANTQWLFFHSWRFTPSSLPTLDVRVANEQAVLVNDVWLNAPGGHTKISAFYPGSYTASFKDQFFAADPVSTAVLNRQDTGGPLSVSPQPTPQLISEISGTIKKYLDACTAQHVLEPANCPFGFQIDRIQSGAAITWSIDKYPDVQLEQNEGKWVIRPLKGVARLQTVGVDLFTGNAVPLNQPVDFVMGADLTITPGGVDVSPTVYR